MNGLGRNQEKKDNTQSVFTKETFGVILVLFSTLTMVCLISHDAIFYDIGKYISAFLCGCFGFCAFAVNAWVFLIGVRLIVGKGLKISFKVKALITFLILCSVLLIQAISMPLNGRDFSAYVIDCYKAGSDGAKLATAGGLLSGMAVYFLLQLSSAGCYALLGVLLVGDVYFLIKHVNTQPKTTKEKKATKFNSSYIAKSEDEINVEVLGEKEYPVNDESFQSQKPTQKLFVSNANDFAFKTKREMSRGETEIKINSVGNGLSMGSVGNNNEFSKMQADELKKKIDYIKTPANIDLQKKYLNGANSSASSVNVSKYISTAPKTPLASNKQTETTSEKQPTLEIPMYEHEETINSDAKTHAEYFSSRYAEVPEEEYQGTTVEPVEDFRPFSEQTDSCDVVEIDTKPTSESEVDDYAFEQEANSEIEQQFLNNEKEKLDSIEEEPKETNVPRQTRSRALFDEEIFNKPEENVAESSAFNSRSNRESVFSNFSREKRNVFESMPKEEPAKNMEKPVIPINRVYNRPPIDLLENYSVTATTSPEPHEERKIIIKQTLEDFRINAEPKDHVQGPTVTRYEIMMPAGISVKKVLQYEDDLRMRLSSKEGVRIEAPIPGKNLVGVEVANKTKVTVGLREIIESTSGNVSKPGALTFAIGKDIVGRAITDNLAKGPHYLVAGATGSGKSVSLDVMIVSLIMRYSPEDLRLILIDPKRVGFRKYEHLPHLMIDEIVIEPQRAVAVLLWACEEMERRYDLFQSTPGVSDIDSYNEKVASDTTPKMPRIVVIVDELADLMETNKKEMDARIRRLSAKARAAGIHLVLATQRPSVDVITGTIKANLPSRIALKVMTPADSITILSEGGAEKLLGTGDMLYKNSAMPECERYQGAWISDREIMNVVNYIKENNSAYFDDSLSQFLDNSTKPVQEEMNFGDDNESDENEVNEFFLKALWLAVNTKSVSISQLQRRFQIGYARAGGLVDKMERMGFVSGNEGSKARRVLLSREEFEERFGPMSDTY